MILYAFKCPSCGHEQDEVLEMAERDNPVQCDNCNRQTRRMIGSKINRVEPTWLDAAVNQLVPHGSDIQPPRDRNEFDLYCKVNRIDVSHGGGPLTSGF